jgi:hypothetical protein
MKGSFIISNIKILHSINWLKIKKFKNGKESFKNVNFNFSAAIGQIILELEVGMAYTLLPGLLL